MGMDQWWSMSIARWESPHFNSGSGKCAVKEKKQNLLQMKHLLKFTPRKLTWDHKMGGICQMRNTFSKGPKTDFPYYSYSFGGL